MVEMLVAGQDQADILHPEAQSLHVGGHQRRGFCGSAVDQHMAGGRSDQDDADPAGADQVGAAVDVRGWGGIIPAVLAGALRDKLGWRRGAGGEIARARRTGCKQQRRGRRCQPSGHSSLH
jgi:hypothetical protein